MDYLTSKFIDRVVRNKEVDDLTRKKIKYGIEVLIINISKLLITIIVAKLLGVLVETIEIIAVVVLIRQYSFGVHANTSFQCTILTVLMFVGPVILSRYVFINSYVCIILFFISSILLYKYAPADTEKRPLVSEAKRTMLKKKVFIMVAFLCIVAFMANVYSLRVNITLGVFIASLITAPIVYRILGQKYKNYERC